MSLQFLRVAKPEAHTVHLTEVVLELSVNSVKLNVYKAH